MAAITLPGGAKFSGTTAEVAEFMAKMGIDGATSGLYYSSSHDTWVPVSTMNPIYLKNALLKRYREWVDELSEVKDFSEFLNKLAAGPTDDAVLVMLLSELTRKVSAS